jgi:hypothetical protein
LSVAGLADLDAQLAEYANHRAAPTLAADTWNHLASAIHDEAFLSEPETNLLGERKRGSGHERFRVSQPDLDCWQALSRGTAIAVLLALCEEG